MTLELDPHQHEAHEAFLGHSNFMLLDDPGCGKTPPAVTAADVLGALPALTVCPQIGLEHWRKHWHDWTVITNPFVYVVEDGDADIPPADVVIVNYDLLGLRRNKKLRKQLMSRRWKLLIEDEGHRAKTSGSNRTRALYGKHCDGKSGLVSRADRVWVMSGTLAPNHLGEVWTHLHALFPETIMDPMKGRPWTEDEFQARYVETEPTKYGPQITGSKNIKDLKRRIGPHVLRRRKKDVIKDMPPLRFSPEPLPLHVLQGLQRHQTVLDKVNALQAQIPNMQGWKDGDVLSYIKAHGEHLATYRKLTGLVKCPLAIEWCEEFLWSGHSKLLIFGVHHVVLDKIFEHMHANGLHPVQIDGRTSKTDRLLAEDTFQNDPKCRVFVGQIRACGEVITLTAGADVAFAEAEWTPSYNLQAACRAHRRGQDRAVTASLLSLPDPWLDGVVNRINARKMNELAQFLDD